LLSRRTKNVLFRERKALMQGYVRECEVRGSMSSHKRDRPTPPPSAEARRQPIMTDVMLYKRGEEARKLLDSLLRTFIASPSPAGLSTPAALARPMNVQTLRPEPESARYSPVRAMARTISCPPAALSVNNYSWSLRYSMSWGRRTAGKRRQSAR
jgi:hypothetical protein